MSGIHAAIQPSTLTPIACPTLLEDGLSICECRLQRGAIRTFRDLEQVAIRGGRDTILLFPRDHIDPAFLREIENEASRAAPANAQNATTTWHVASGASVHNAIPHHHDSGNFHAAFTATETPTVFYNRSAVFRAVCEIVCEQEDLELDVRQYLTGALELWDAPPSPYFFFMALHMMDRHFDETTLLSLVHDIQERVERSGGLYKCDLNSRGHGIVYIPPRAIHGRYVVQDLARSTESAWRYFGDPIPRPPLPASIGGNTQ